MDQKSDKDRWYQLASKAKTTLGEFGDEGLKKTKGPSDKLRIALARRCGDNEDTIRAKGGVLPQK